MVGDITVHMARVYQRPYGLWYAALDGSPTRIVAADPRLADDAARAVLVQPGNHALEQLGTRVLVGGRETTLWALPPGVGAAVLAFVAGEADARMAGSVQEMEAWLSSDAAAETAYAKAEEVREQSRKLAEEERRAASLAREAEIARRYPDGFDPDLLVRQFLDSEPVADAFVPTLEPCGGADAVSGFFVHPWIAAGDSWPVRDGVPMQAVLQLDIASLPEPVCFLLGSEGFFQFFMGGEFDYADNQANVLFRRVHPARAAGSFVPPPPQVVEKAASEGWNPRAVLSWQPKGDHWPASHEDFCGRADAFAEEHLLDFGIEAPTGIWGTKLLGNPTWVQPPSWPEADGRRMVFLMQVHDETDETPGLFGADWIGGIFFDPENPDCFVIEWAR